ITLCLCPIPSTGTKKAWRLMTTLVYHALQQAARSVSYAGVMMVGAMLRHGDFSVPVCIVSKYRRLGAGCKAEKTISRSVHPLTLGR
ncbi:MAG: hypothetical protein JXQ72_14495, partial [Anaerolineae bacterium]|nr:hypothetical protein [Anaerolineae bacterium]